MPPLSLISSSAICLRCQFRYSYRLQLPQRTFPPPLRLRSAFFTTTLLSKAKALPARELVILEPPGPRKSLHRYAPPTYGLDDTNLDSGIQQLLTFEFKDQNIIDATHIGILLCKPHITRVSRERYIQISTEINRAFLKPQLFDYYTRSVKGKPSALGRYSKKSELLDEIMRNMWGIEITDEIAEREDVLRDKEIKSARRDIFFMIGEDGRVLRKWAQQYSTRITVNVMTSVLMLRGSLANIEKIEEEIKNMLEKLISEDIDLSWVSRLETFNEQFIAPIARITNTFIENLGDTVRVVALGPERDAIEDARRLLFTSLDLQFRTSYSLLYNAPRGQKGIEGSLYPFSEDSSLPWRFRGRNWARWRDVKRKLPQPPETGLEPPLSHENPHAIEIEHEGSSDVLGEIRKILDESANIETMELEEQQVPSAGYQVILGCLLHDSNGHNTLKGPQFLERFIKEEKPRVICQDFPGVSFIAQLPRGRTGPPLFYRDQMKPVEDEVAYSFILRFAPSPWTNRDTFEHFPPLEMTLAVDPRSGEVGDPHLVAVHSESIADFLLPSQNCDLRFLRRSEVPLNLNVSPLEVAAGGVTKEEVVRFLGESNLNPTGNKKLRASPQIKVSIPQWMMQRCPDSPTGEVDYIFTGMEFRRELKFDWEGHYLYHTIVEGGVSGGKKSEVKLVCKAAVGVENQSKKTRKLEQELEEPRAGKEVGVEEPSGSEPEALESETVKPNASGHETLKIREPESHESDIRELEVPAKEYDIAFLSFVNSTMKLVDSLEKRLSGSISRGRGVLR